MNVCIPCIFIVIEFAATELVLIVMIVLSFYFDWLVIYLFIFCEWTWLNLENGQTYMYPEIMPYAFGKKNI